MGMKSSRIYGCFGACLNTQNLIVVALFFRACHLCLHCVRSHFTETLDRSQIEYHYAGKPRQLCRPYGGP